MTDRDEVKQTIDDGIYHDRDCAKPSAKHFYQIRPYYEGSERLAIILHCADCGNYIEMDAQKSFRTQWEQLAYESYVLPKALGESDASP